MAQPIPAGPRIRPRYFNARAEGAVAVAGRAVFAPPVGAPLLMSNVVTLAVGSFATNKRVPVGFTARATGFVAPAGRAVLAPAVGAPPLMSNVVTLALVRSATNRRVPAGFTARARGPV